MPEHRTSDPAGAKAAADLGQPALPQPAEREAVLLARALPELAALLERRSSNSTGSMGSGRKVNEGVSSEPRGARRQEVIHQGARAGGDPAIDLVLRDPEARAVPQVLDRAAVPAHRVGPVPDGVDPGLQVVGSAVTGGLRDGGTRREGARSAVSASDRRLGMFMGLESPGAPRPTQHSSAERVLRRTAASRSRRANRGAGMGRVDPARLRGADIVRAPGERPSILHGRRDPGSLPGEAPASPLSGPVPAPRPPISAPSSTACARPVSSWRSRRRWIPGSRWRRSTGA